MVGQRLVIAVAKTKARRTGTADAASRPQRVELTERSVVHSDTTTRGWVTPVGRDRYTTVVVAWALRVIRAAVDPPGRSSPTNQMHECEAALNGT
jgi:hypothetical protein